MPRPTLLTRVQVVMTQLVLPNMANHHGNTFGGQVMAWIAEAATIAAKRQVGHSLAPSRRAWAARDRPAVRVSVLIIDALSFYAKSCVGDRVVLRATVHRVFDTTMEVGVSVRACGMDGQLRHINAAFLTIGVRAARRGPRRSERPLRLNLSFVSEVAGAARASVREDATGAEGGGAAAGGGAVAVVSVAEASGKRASREAAVAAHTAAFLRRQLRLQRRAMLSLAADAMAWSPTLKEELCICNLLGLSRVAQQAAEGAWEDVAPAWAASAGVSVQLTRDLFGRKTRSLRVTMLVGAPVDAALAAVADMEQRLQWDSLLETGRVHATLDESNQLVHLAMRPIAWGLRRHDYALLQSTRRNADGSCVVASRSVTDAGIPPVKGVRRGVVLPSGFLIEPTPTAPPSASPADAAASAGGGADGADSAPRTRVTYIVQMAEQRDITGALSGRIISEASRLFAERMLRLQGLLEGRGAHLTKGARRGSSRGSSRGSAMAKGRSSAGSASSTHAVVATGVQLQMGVTSSNE